MLQNSKIWVTEHKTGKLQSFYSINTSTFDNPFCMKQPTEICKFCYAHRLERLRKSMHEHFIENGKVLETLLPIEDLPYFAPGSVVRFHSYGELRSMDHFFNFVNIAKKNPGSIFALWTKWSIIGTMQFEKPDNLILIYSEGCLDNEVNEKKYHTLYNFDHIFTVDTEDHGQINCNAHCATCMKCYSKNDIYIIHEMIRKAGGKSHYKKN